MSQGHGHAGALHIKYAGGQGVGVKGGPIDLLSDAGGGNIGQAQSSSIAFGLLWFLWLLALSEMLFH